MIWSVRYSYKPELPKLRQYSKSYTLLFGIKDFREAFGDYFWRSFGNYVLLALLFAFSSDMRVMSVASHYPLSLAFPALCTPDAVPLSGMKIMLNAYNS